MLKFIKMRESCGFIIGMELEGGGALKRYLSMICLATGSLSLLENDKEYVALVSKHLCKEVMWRWWE